MKKAKLLWVDLEMTGLEPERDRILEIAAVATDWNLEEPARSSASSSLTSCDARSLGDKPSSLALRDVASNKLDDHRGILARNGAEFTAVVKVPMKLMEERMVGEFWEENAAVREALMKQNKDGMRVDEVEEMLLKFMDEWFGEEIILAGNSIHQDRKFIDKEWPKVAKRLHYRMLDVSAWKVVFEGRYGKRFWKVEEHRALDDIRGSIEELEFYLKEIKLQ